MNEIQSELTSSSRSAHGVVSYVLFAFVLFVVLLLSVLYFLTRGTATNIIRSDGWKGTVVNTRGSGRGVGLHFNIDTGGSDYMQLLIDPRHPQAINDMETGDSIEFVHDSNVARIKRSGAASWTTVKKLRELD